MDRLTLYGSFTSSSSYKPMLYLALARLPFSFRTVNLKTGVQKTPEYLAMYNLSGVLFMVLTTEGKIMPPQLSRILKLSWCRTVRYGRQRSNRGCL